MIGCFKKVEPKEEEKDLDDETFLLKQEEIKKGVRSQKLKLWWYHLITTIYLVQNIQYIVLMSSYQFRYSRFTFDEGLWKTVNLTPLKVSTHKMRKEFAETEQAAKQNYLT